MKLNQQQLYRASRFHAFLKIQTNEYYKINGITPCRHCGRTGLIQFRHYDENGKEYYNGWDTESFCDECNGIGYKGRANTLQIDDQHFICRQCDGIGCKDCEYTGIVDWVTNLMGR